MFPLSVYIFWSCQIPLIFCIFCSHQIPLNPCNRFYRFRSFRSICAHSGQHVLFLSRIWADSSTRDMGNVKSTDEIHFLVSTDLQINSKFFAKNDFFPFVAEKNHRSWKEYLPPLKLDISGSTNTMHFKYYSYLWIRDPIVRPKLP